MKIPADELRRLVKTKAMKVGARDVSPLRRAELQRQKVAMERKRSK